MFSNILVPVDLTDQNVHAIETTRRLVAAEGGKVTVLHVIETLDAPFEELRDFYERLEAGALGRIEVLAAPLRRAGLDPILHVTYGKRAAEVIRFATEEDIDLIVLSSTRITPENMERKFLSISHQVAILAPCPVLVMK